MPKSFHNMETKYCFGLSLLEADAIYFELHNLSENFCNVLSCWGYKIYTKKSTQHLLSVAFYILHNK